MRAIRRQLASLLAPVPPIDLVASITNVLAIEAGAMQRQPRQSFMELFVQWASPRLMPYSVGLVVSVLLFISVIGSLRPHLIALREAEIASQDIDLGYEITRPVTSQNFAIARAPFAEDSPSLNPGGALAALSFTHPQGEGDDDVMIVVATVFTNGRATLSDVMQAPRDRRMLDEFQDALRKNAAFVPASFDRRPETMQVVLSFQKVEVSSKSF
jgi:hypothetical protein